MNINKIKPIRQLPELEDQQEQACEGGCDHIEPKLHRNIYAESWDLQGNKTREEAEHYYTCGKGHLLAVWGTETNDYITLPDQAYQNRQVSKGLTLSHVEKMIADLQSEKQRMMSNFDSLDQEYFKFAKIGFELTFKSGEVLSVDEHCLNEIRAQLLESEIKP